MLKTLLTSLALFSVTAAQADTILCLNPDQTVRTARHVDVVEGEFYDDLKPSKELEGLTWQQQLAAVINRAAFADIALDRRLREFTDFRLSSRDNEIFGRTFNTDTVFSPSQIRGTRVAPVGAACHLVGELTNQGMWSRLVISHFIWKNLPARDKASALLHRALQFAYEELNQKALPDSLQADLRKVVAFLLSDRFDGKNYGKDSRVRFHNSPYFLQSRLYSFKDPETDIGKIYDYALDGLAESLRPFLSQQRERRSLPLLVDKGFCPRGITVVTEYAVFDLHSPLYKCHAKVSDGERSRVIEPYEAKAARGTGSMVNAIISTSKILVKPGLDHSRAENIAGPSSIEVMITCAGAPWPKPDANTISSGGYNLYCGTKLLGAVINSRFDIAVKEGHYEFGTEAEPVRADY